MTFSHLPLARVLMRSLERWLPGAERYVLLLDGEPGADEPFVTLRPDDVEGLGTEELLRQGMAFPTQGLVSAQKPRLLAHLLRATGRPGMLFDADMSAFASLAPIAAQLGAHDVLLATHDLRPGPLEQEAGFLQAGVFNGGFLGATAGGLRFLDWWAGRVRRDCVFDVERQRFMSQSWLAFAPAMCDAGVIRDPGFNAMGWNLAGRTVRWDGDDAPTVDDAPLRLFHFTGFDPHRPERLSLGEWAADWARPADEPGLGRLCAQYARDLLAAGHDEHRAAGSRFAADRAGRPITDADRAAYRAALVAAEEGALPEPLNPLVTA